MAFRQLEWPHWLELPTLGDQAESGQRSSRSLDAHAPSRASLSANAYRDRLVAAEIRVWKLPTRQRRSWLRDENRQTRRHRQHLRERITFHSRTLAGELRPRRSPINFQEAA